MKLRAAKIGVVVGGTLFGVSVGLVAFYFWLTHGEIQENRYATYAETRESLDRGWLPSVLPRSATSIHEWHELDTNQCFASFQFDPSERPTIEPTLRRGVRPTIRIDRDPSFASPLRLDPSKEQLESSGFELYSDRDVGFAINWNNGIGYSWNCSP